MDAEEFDEINWNEAAFSQIDAAVTNPARVLSAVKELLQREGHSHIQIEYPAGDALLPPSSSDRQVAELLGAQAMQVLPKQVFKDGKLDEAALLESLEQSRRSLFERFRGRTNRLSVSDLVGPLYCETQYAYGLLGRRSWRIENRPSVIVLPPKPGDTGPPRQIVPNKDLMKARDGILKRGHQVHAKLERELAPEPAKPIYVDTRVDRVGAQLLDLCAALNALVVDGKAREIPVFGVLQGFQIAGVIDEIYRRELDAPTPSKSKKGKSPAKDKSQGTLDSFFGVKPPAEPDKRYGYFVLDHKTRTKRTLPLESAATASRFQVMTYKRLFDELATGAYSWADHFARLRVSDTSVPFSQSFLDQTAELRTSIGPGAGVGLEDGIAPDNLDDLVAILVSYFQRIGPLQDELQLKYLFRERGSSKSKHVDTAAIKAKAAEEADIKAAIEASLREAGAPSGPSAEEEELAKAMAMSLEEAPAKPVAEDLDDEETQVTIPSKSKQRSPTPAADEDEVICTGSKSAPDLSEQPTPAKRKRASSVELTTPSKSSTPGKLIGTDTFRYDDTALDAHLADVARFWRSEREPRGVPIEEVFKCTSCEYIEGCEWREAQAAKIAAKARARSGSAR